MRDKRGFEAARAASLLSNAIHARRMGAALFAGATLLSVGYNEYNKTHPQSPRHTIHAEHRALLRRQYRTNNNLTMYVYRETTDGKPASSRPCENCLRLMREAGVRVVKYFDAEGLPQQRSL